MRSLKVDVVVADSGVGAEGGQHVHSGGSWGALQQQQQQGGRTQHTHMYVAAAAAAAAAGG